MLACWSVLTAHPWTGAVAASDQEVAAHRVAMEMAGAFSNESFKLRDGKFAGSISRESAVVIQVNLYAGNQYWFSVGATEQAKKMAVSVYDEAGHPAEVDALQEASRAAAGFSPTASGPYFILIEEIEGEPASFCFLYSYK